MRALVWRAVAVGLVLGLAGLGRAQPADEAKAVLDKAIAAHGGEAKLSQLKAARAKNKGKIDIAGGVEFTQQTTFLYPDKFRDDMDLEVNGQRVNVVTVYDGKKGAITVNGKKLPANDKIEEALKGATDMIRAMRLVPLRDKAYELAPLGETAVNDKPAVGLRISKKGQKDINAYFDKKTGRMAKIEYRTVEPMSGQEITEERVVTEYQTVDGLPVAKRVVLNRDGKRFLDAEVLEMQFLESLDEAEFRLPE